MIHLYNSKGIYVRSFCKISDLLEPLNLRIYRSVNFSLDEDDNIYAVQPMEYKVAVFDKNGNYKRVFGHKNKHYMDPHYLPRDVQIDDNRPIFKKFASGMSAVTGAAVSTAKYVASRPLIATIILVLIILGTVTYYSRDFLII